MLDLKLESQRLPKLNIPCLDFVSFIGFAYLSDRPVGFQEVRLQESVKKISSDALNGIINRQQVDLCSILHIRSLQILRAVHHKPAVEFYHTSGSTLFSTGVCLAYDKMSKQLTHPTICSTDILSSTHHLARLGSCMLEEIWREELCLMDGDHITQSHSQIVSDDLIHANLILLYTLV